MDISRLQIDQSKMLASGEEYFKLFEKHLPTGLDSNKTVLVYEISNLSCIKKIVSLNPEAKHIVVGSKACNRALKMVLPKAIDVEYLEEFDFKETDMKFDCIVMNPPYQRNLHLKILAEAIKHLKDEKSVCVNLSPITWAGKHNICQPKGKWREKLNGKIDSLDFIEHRTANNLFGTGNAIEDLAIITCKINGKFDIIHYGFTSSIEESIYRKITPFKNDKRIMTLGQACGKSIYGCGNGLSEVVRQKFDIPIYTWHGGKTMREALINYKVGADEKCAAAFRFNTAQEQQNFINSLDTIFLNWYYKMFIVPGDYKLAAYMFRMSDYSQPWDDARFYKFFNITPEEQKLIESAMKAYEAK